MNKFIIFVLLFIVAFCEDDDDSWMNEYLYDGKEAKLCNEVEDTKEPSVSNCTSVDKCCYLLLKFDDDEEDEKECIAMKKSKVNDFIKKYKKKYEGDNISIDCSSNYLSKALIILFSLII